MKKTILIGGAIGIVAILSLVGCLGSGQQKAGTNQQSNGENPVQQNDTMISIPLAGLSTTAKFYAYDASGVTIRYFTAKDAKGSVHVAFDACDVCYAAKKGYKQVGDVMQCLNCGRQFAISSIGTENTQGGCWPSYLPMTVNGSAITIKIADLIDKLYMFE